MPRTNALRTLLVVLLCSGCWGADDDDDDAADAGPGDAGSAAAFPTTFVFANLGDDPVVIGGTCGETWPTLSQHDVSVDIHPSCDCACEDLDSPAGCGGCPLICANTTELVVPGVPHTSSWDGLVLNRARQECYTLEAPVYGSLFMATVFHHDGSGDNPGSNSSDFKYGVERDLTITFADTFVTEPPGPQPIVIENQTDVPIDIVVDSCGSQTWFRFAEDDPRITNSVFCSCSCNDEFQAETCPDCGACAEDEVVTLAPGESHVDQWDGRFWYSYDSGCSRNYAMPAQYGPLVKVCFTRLGDGSETCTTPQPLVRGGAATFLVTE